MGRNAEIKRFDSTPGGQPMDLFQAKEGRLPVIIELLRSPWIIRASELSMPEDTGTGKRLNAPVAVAWDERRCCPSAFEFNGRTYRVDAIVQVWAVERRWWTPRRVSRRYWRVLARGGTYDLAYDRLRKCWILAGIVD
ncbi:MAG: hypothetical protein OEV43_01850 [Coriobacteriia bacterium]|nr:hypothetical protein [Coriobacteriia bacterium]